nr:glycosyltransferase family 2 protein [Mycoplasmoidaceae bacterium]
MNISLIYHINSNHETLKQSLKSIFDQSSQDFEFILIDDNSTDQVKTCVNQFNFNKLKKFTYINSNQKLGHSFSFNVGLDNTKSKYVYYLGSNIILEKDFIKKMNSVIEEVDSPDFIILTNLKKQKQVIKTYKTVNKNLFKVLRPSIKD